MKALLQRVTEASVSVNGEVIGKCGEGLLILLGVEIGDTPEDVTLLSEKIVKLRIFSDMQGKMNRSLLDIGGTALVISQFTLCADYRHGNRPDYLGAARPEQAIPLYEAFVTSLRTVLGESAVETGQFGADMQVKLCNNGPVTIMMESSVLRKKGERVGTSA